MKYECFWILAPSYFLLKIQIFHFFKGMLKNEKIRLEQDKLKLRYFYKK